MAVVVVPAGWTELDEQSFVGPAVGLAAPMLAARTSDVQVGFPSARTALVEVDADANISDVATEAMGALLSIGHGTTGTTALVVDESLTIRGRATREFRQVFPRPGWVEHEATAIWESVESAVFGALKDANVSPKEIAAIGITNQRETTCLFE